MARSDIYERDVFQRDFKVSSGRAISLIGDAELKQTLLGLTDAVLNKLMKPAIKAGLRPILKQAKENATPGNIFSSDATGAMRDAIASRVTATKEKGVIGRIFVSKKKSIEVNGKKHNPGAIAIAVEFGHYNEKYNYRVEAKPFMRPAMDVKKTEAMGVITSVAQRLLPSAINEARAKEKQVFYRRANNAGCRDIPRGFEKLPACGCGYRCGSWHKNLQGSCSRRRVIPIRDAYENFRCSHEQPERLHRQR